MKSPPKLKGFSLIELMIVVAIIGILASIAVPSYKNYIVKANLTELFVFANSLKTYIAEYVAENPGVICTSIPSTTVPNLQGKNVLSTSFHTGNCYIEVAGSPGGVGMGGGPGGYFSVFLKPVIEGDGSIQWRCALWAPNGPGTISEFAPPSCPAVASFGGIV